MRRLLLLSLLATAATAYNLVLQQFEIKGGNVQSGVISCDNMNFLHVFDKTTSVNYDCFKNMNTATPPAVESITLVYKGNAFTTKAAKIPCEIGLKDGSTLAFDIIPSMKVGVLQPVDGTTLKFTSVVPTGPTTAAVPESTSEPCPAGEVPGTDGKGGCQCPAGQTRGTDNKCKCGDNQTLTTEFTCKCIDGYQFNDAGTCEKPNAPKNVGDQNQKVVKKTMARPGSAAAAAAADSADATMPLVLRPRGPGPVRLPTHASEEDTGSLRKKRADAAEAAQGDVDNKVKVTLYVLDEGGNPTAVWAAVIEGIILIVLVGLCIWVFFIAPRRRGASGGGDQYKPEDPNYSVSYNNTGYNQRIDAFQNPPAPPRPANNAYMDDYITDNVGAMSRPAAAATTTQPTAVNPAISNFQPTHQRFDSSGLVTVNLS